MSNEFINQYAIVVVFILLGIALPVVALSFGKLLRPNKPTEEKATTYESGNEPIGEGQVRFNARYYMYALLFVIFEVETIFLYPWAVTYKSLGWFAFVEMIIFLGLLGIGLLYAYRKKVLSWTSL